MPVTVPRALAAQVTLTLFMQQYVTINYKPNQLIQTIWYVLNNNVTLGQLANSSSVSLENVTTILQQYYDCLLNKTRSNKSTIEVFNCFIAPTPSTTLQTCELDDIMALVTYVMFFAGIVFLIGMSFGHVRKSCWLKCCYGRPGCAVPLNMLDSYENRIGNALAFAATTTRCFLIVLGDNSSLVGTTSAAYLANPNTPKFIPVFAKIVVTAVVAVSYYPLFACMIMDNKLIGSILGALYALLWTGLIIFRLYANADCFASTPEILAFVLGYEIPGAICMILLLCKFIYVFQDAVRRRIKLRLKNADISNMTSNEIYSDWKEQYMYQHVKNLLKGAPKVQDDLEDDEDLKFKDKLKRKVYKFKPDFKYSTRVICALSVACYASFMMMMGFCLIWYIFVSQMAKAYIYSSDLETALQGNSQLVDTVRQYFDALNISFFVAAVLAEIVFCIVVMNMLSWYRGHIIRLRKGDRSWLPSLIRRQDFSPTSLTVASMKFAGYQVGYAVWGTAILTIVFWIILGVVSTQIVLPLVKSTWSPLLRLLFRMWPVVFVSIVIYLVQFFVVKCFFLHDKGASLSINNRNAYHVTSYFLFFFNIALGLVSCLLRIGYSVIVGVLFLARLQKSLLPRSYEKRDPGFMSYIGYIMLEHTHANPVVCVFSNLLVDDDHDLRKVVSSQDGVCVIKGSFKMDKVSGKAYEEYDIQGEKHKRKLLARNRWSVAVTLLHNPSLKKYRSPVKKKKGKTIMAMVKGLHNPALEENA